MTRERRIQVLEMILLAAKEKHRRRSLASLAAAYGKSISVSEGEASEVLTMTVEEAVS